MFSTQQINDFQHKVQETFNQAQSRAAERARALEAEARKFLQEFGDKAQVELGKVMDRAQGISKEQMLVLGSELIKLGQRLQELARRMDAKAPEAAHAAAPDTEAGPGEPTAKA